MIEILLTLAHTRAIRERDRICFSQYLFLTTDMVVWDLVLLLQLHCVNTYIEYHTTWVFFAKITAAISPCEQPRYFSQIAAKYM